MSTTMLRTINGIIAACVFFITLVLFSSGCSVNKQPEPMIVYRDVLVPTKCNIIVPLRPVYNSDVVLATIDILEYTNKLEIALRACIR